MRMGLTISTKKSKIMAVLPSLGAHYAHQLPKPVPVLSDLLSVVSDFEYQGSIITSDCNMDKEIDSGISKSSRCFRSLCRMLWYQRRIKTTTQNRAGLVNHRQQEHSASALSVLQKNF